MEHRLLLALLTAAAMFWQVGWSLVLGFFISALLQVVISRDAIVGALGRGGAAQLALAAAAGAASSSCSYAAAAICRTLFARGAALGPSLAFLVASTNLVAELGIVLFLLIGWQFTIGEWVGGMVMVAIVGLLVQLTCPPGLVAAARAHALAAEGGAAPQMAAPAGAPESVLAQRARRATWARVAQAFVMDWSMLWRDLALGFVIAGALAAFVPDRVWQTFFLRHLPDAVRVPGDALLGPLVAALSFVCSIGNVPMAAVLWGAGVSFGGVLAFLYADLIVLPLLDVYRRQFGWRMAAYIAAVLYAAMVAAALIMSLAFAALGWVPAHGKTAAAPAIHFSINYTFWLNCLALVGAGCLVVLHRRAPPRPPECAHHHHE